MDARHNRTDGVGWSGVTYRTPGGPTEAACRGCRRAPARAGAADEGSTTPPDTVRGEVGGTCGSAVGWGRVRGRRGRRRRPERGGSPPLPAGRRAPRGPGGRAAEQVPHSRAPAGRRAAGVWGRKGSDDEGGRPLRQRSRPPGVCVVTVKGGDGPSRAVPRRCLPSVRPLAVRAGGRLGRYPAPWPRPGGGPPECSVEGGDDGGGRPFRQRCRATAAQHREWTGFTEGPGLLGRVCSGAVGAAVSDRGGSDGQDQDQQRRPARHGEGSADGRRGRGVR